MASRAAGLLLASLTCLALAAPGASADDRIHLIVRNYMASDIVLTSSSAQPVVSSDCANNLPFTVEAGTTEDPCSIVIDSDDENVWWYFNATFGGEGFNFNTGVVDPTFGPVTMIGSACDPAATCPFYAAGGSGPSLSDQGGSQYDVIWTAALGQSLVPRPSAMISGRSAHVPVTCNRAAGRRGTLRLDARGSGFRKIGAARYRLAEGGGAIHVPLGRFARRQLRSHGTLQARTTVRSTGANDQPSPTRYPVELRK